MRRRTLYLRVIVALALLGLSGRLSWLQVVKASEIAARTEAIRVERRAIEPDRGAIVDRNGKHLAMAVPYYAAIADNLQLNGQDKERLYKELPALIGLDAQQIRAKLAENPTSGYIPLVEGLSLEQKQVIDHLKMPLPGITLERRVKRAYPQGFTANQVVGYLDKADNGKYYGGYGLEAKYDTVLAGEPGWIEAEFTYGNIPIDGTLRGEQKPVPGKDIVLTLDVGLQQYAETKLDQVVKETKAKRAMALAMDIHTGEILLMAMRPGANPGDRSTWVGPDNKLDFNRINNWSVNPLPPGSIFKTVTVSSAIEEKAITKNSTFIDSGQVVIDGAHITNWDGYVPPNPAPMSVAELMQHSSNVGLIQIGQQMSHDQFVKHLRDYGFMEPTGIDFSYEDNATGLSNFDEKKMIDWAGMYIGQHLEVTPVQMVTAVAAIANGGTLVQPHLVREVRNPDGSVVSTTPTDPKRRVISEQTAKDVRELMVSVVEQGTAHDAKPPGYRVGGKTGTAQKFENGAQKDRGVADFVGFAPADNPEVVMLIVIDEPEPPGFGGVVAAPVFRDLLPQVMRLRGIAPDATAVGGQTPVTPKITSAPLPNVQWLPVARAQQRLEQAGFKAKVTGTGQLVKTQSIVPGTQTNTGTTVELVTVARGPDTEPVRVPDFTGLSLAEANQLAEEIGLTAKSTGSGFVASQDQPVGAQVPPRSKITVRLAPR